MHMHTAVCSRYIKVPQGTCEESGTCFYPPTPLPPRDLTPTTSLFSSLGSGKVVQVSYQCEDKSGKAGCGSVKTLKYLLDSALTLSISPIRVTSLSIRLEQSRKTYLWIIFTATGVHTQKKELECINYVKSFKKSSDYFNDFL